MRVVHRPSVAFWRRILFATLVGGTAVLGFSVRGSAQVAGQGAAASHGINPAYFDTTCAACSQFYRYANGSWLKTVSIPPDYPEWGAFAAIYERSLVALRAALDSLPRSNPAPGTPEWKVAH